MRVLVLSDESNDSAWKDAAELSQHTVCFESWDAREEVHCTDYDFVIVQCTDKDEAEVFIAAQELAGAIMYYAPEGLTEVDILEQAENAAVTA